MGAWARREIQPDERVMSERAFYTCRGNAYETEDMQPYIQPMDDLCPGLAGWDFGSGRPQRTRRVYNSAFTPKAKRLQQKRQVTRLILSRALRDEIVLGPVVPSDPTYRLFSTISKINHSCDPNCRYLVDTPHRLNPVFVVIANRVIAADEEITISYSHKALLTHDVQARRNILADNCGIRYCRCPRCESDFKKTVSRGDKVRVFLDRKVKGIKRKWSDKVQIMKDSLE
jgi:hypothetical protein